MRLLTTALTASSALMAEDSSEGETSAALEEVVLGIRGSLERSMDMKRDATGVVDGISERWVNSLIQTLLKRFNAFQVYQSVALMVKVPNAVRGFGPDFNLVTLNGRQMPGTGNSRSYNLENLSSEGVDALQVQKTARASTPSGGLGATVNIVTTKPLDNPGEEASFAVKSIYDSSNVEGDDFTPEVAGVYSNTLTMTL